VIGSSPSVPRATSQVGLFRLAALKVVDWYMQGKIEIDPMITHTMPLDEINKAFDLMHAGKSIRSVVVY